MAAAEIPTFLPGISDPFPGLRPFESDEEAIFRGRQKQADELLRRLAGHRFLAVVGTSGSGKSSLVRAGLLPALDRGFLAGATSRWRIAVMRPGMAPIDNLADALRGNGAQQAQLEGAEAALAVGEMLRSSSLGLVEVVRNAKLAYGESLLVVADQFEELFRYYRRMTAVDGGGEAAQFVQLLLTAARRPDAPVYVVLTMRSDFLGDCALFPGLPEALSESQYLIPRLTREQRREAIVEPLRLFGATMTPQLVEQLLNDSGDEPTDPPAGARYGASAPDPLPVLQHALMRTYLEWKSLPPKERAGPIDLPQYRGAGRMETALNQHAERLFTEDLDDQGRRWAERIFRCLTTTELGRPVRRPTPLAELYKVVGAKDEEKQKIDGVLDLFQRRENSFVQLNKDRSADISHESLIWKWKRLGGWVTDEAAGAELYRDLVKDASGKATWSEPKLSTALAVSNKNVWNADWARQYSENRFEDVEAFLARSQKAVRNERWLRWFGVTAATAVVILAVFAYYSRRETLQKIRELDTAQIAQRSLASEQKALQERISGLSDKQGSTQEERDLIASQKAALEAQLTKSQQDSQKLAAQVQQSSTDSQASVAGLKTLQSELAAAQRDRDEAVKARQDAESKSAQLAKDLEKARAAAAAVVPAPQPALTLETSPKSPDPLPSGDAAGSGTPLPAGKTHALSVGISKYERLQPALWSKSAGADAEMVADFLRSPRGGADSSTLLRDGAATLAAVRGALETLAKAGPADTVIITISSLIVNLSGKQWILLYDSNPEAPQLTALSQDELNSAFNRKTGPRTVIEYLELNLYATGRTVPKQMVQPNPTNGSSLYVLSASNRQGSLEGLQFGGHSAFMYYLVKGLFGDADANHDGQITRRELQQYVISNVMAATGKAASKQTIAGDGNLAPEAVLVAPKRRGTP